MWFPVRQEPRWLLRIDILQCIGLALLLALPILAFMATSPRALRFMALALALGAFFAAPFGEAARRPWAALLNVSTGSLFPLLPWSGYVYLGASAGAVAALGDGKSLRRWLLGLLLLGAAVSQMQRLPLKPYPPGHLWINDPAVHGLRWALVALLALGLLMLEARTRQAPVRSRAVRFVEAFGTSSLAAYFFHEALMYYETFGFSFHRFWGGRCGWPAYWVLTGALIGCTFVLVLIADWLYQRAGEWPADLGVFHRVRSKIEPKPNR
jgi:hypothetical protein